MPLSSLRQPNPVYGDEYRAIVSVLIEARREGGLTQRELAARIKKVNSHVNVIERGIRRVDILEFWKIAKAIGVEPQDLFAQIDRALEAIQLEARADAPPPKRARAA